ncbi:unnamed protein product [Staurois parvus]|uniref:Uncharacterized protein n=1 Tax=Staurois parvus TaxID=386267 RepID=A0ABN9H6K8_9NEOB|nr:unnamed protein product [Staurois parvus]
MEASGGDWQRGVEDTEWRPVGGIGREGVEDTEWRLVEGLAERAAVADRLCEEGVAEGGGFWRCFGGLRRPGFSQSEWMWGPKERSELGFL